MFQNKYLEDVINIIDPEGEIQNNMIESKK